MLKPFTSLVITVRTEILVILYVKLNFSLPPPPNTYFLVMITECVCYQDKVSPRFHIPGILSEDHASPCKTIHILGGGGPRTTSRKLIHQSTAQTTVCRWYIRAASIIYYHYSMAQLLQYPWTMHHRCCVQLIENVLTTQSLFLILILCSEIVTVNLLFVFST